MKFINIGYGNMVAVDRIVTLVSPDSAPIKRLIQDAKDDGARHPVGIAGGDYCQPAGQRRRYRRRGGGWRRRPHRGRLSRDADFRRV